MGESRGDDAARKQRWADATAGYNEALRDETVFAYERARLQEKLSHVGGKKVTEESRVVAAEGLPLVRLEKLAAKRKEARSYGAPPEVEAAVVADMQTAATEAWPEVEALAAKKHFHAALTLAERIVTALEGKTPLVARHADLQARARTHHEALQRAAGGNPGAELLHARLVQRAGGPAASSAETDRLARLTWRFSLNGAPGCEPVAKAMTNGLRTGEGQTIELALQIASCPAAKSAKTSTEPYTYTVQIPYQEAVTVTVNKQVSTTKYRPEQVCGPSTSYKTGPGIGGGSYSSRECHTETRPYTETTTVPTTETQMVTKYRTESRSATRETTLLDYSASITGSAKAAYDGQTEELPLSSSKTLSDKIVKDHEGQRGPTASVNEQRALADARAQLEGTLKALGDRVQAARARSHAQLAKTALDAGQTVAAEHELVLAAVATGSPAPEGSAYFTSTYGLAPSDLNTVLAGMNAPSVAGGGGGGAAVAGSGGAGGAVASGPSRAVGRDAPAEEKAERGRIGGTSPAWWGLGLERIETETLGTMPSRDMVGVAGSWSFAGLSRLHDSTWGLQFLDELGVRGAFGGRTSDPIVFANGTEDGALAYHVTAGYLGMLGYRARHFGLFAGARTAARYAAIGEIEMSGIVLPVSARAEFRLGGPAVITAQVWGGKLAFDHETRGVDVTLPIGRGAYAVRARAEQWVLGTNAPGPSALESADLGRFTSTAVSGEFGAEF